MNFEEYFKNSALYLASQEASRMFKMQQDLTIPGYTYDLLRIQDAFRSQNDLRAVFQQTEKLQEYCGQRSLHSIDYYQRLVLSACLDNISRLNMSEVTKAALDKIHDMERAFFDTGMSGVSLELMNRLNELYDVKHILGDFVCTNQSVASVVDEFNENLISLTQELEVDSSEDDIDRVVAAIKLFLSNIKNTIDENKYNMLVALVISVVLYVPELRYNIISCILYELYRRLCPQHGTKTVDFVRKIFPKTSVFEGQDKELCEVLAGTKVYSSSNIKSRVIDEIGVECCVMQKDIQDGWVRVEYEKEGIVNGGWIIDKYIRNVQR